MDPVAYQNHETLVQNITKLALSHKLDLDPSKVMIMATALRNPKCEDQKPLLDKCPSYASAIFKTAKSTVKTASTIALFRGYCWSHRREIICLFLWVLLNLGMFGVGVWIFFDMMNRGVGTSNQWMIPAFGAGLVVELNAGIFIFLPAWRRLTTWLRKTRLTVLVPFDATIKFHIICGTTICIFAVIHVICVIVCFYINSSKPTSQHPFLERLSAEYVKFPGWFGYMGPTGFLMLSCLAAMSFTSLSCIRRSRGFNVYFWVHKLQLVFWVALVFHSNMFWKILVGPAAIFALEKLSLWSFVLWRSGSRLKRAAVLPGQAAHLEITRPVGFKYSPGDYVYVCIPGISVFQWHPFTLSSGPEVKDFLSFHVKASGDWTNYLQKYLTNQKNRNGLETVITAFEEGPHKTSADVKIHMQEKENGQPTLRFDVDILVFLDGPYSASTSSIFYAEHAVLIAAGIGVTPFASILSSVLYQFKQQRTQNASQLQINDRKINLKRLDLIWIIRDLESVTWFHSLLAEWEREQEQQQNRLMNCHIYLTSVSPISESSDELLQQGLKEYHSVTGTDAVTGLRSLTKFGRPNWSEVFSEIDVNKSAPVRLFFCGNQTLENVVRKQCGLFNFEFSWEQF